MTKIEKSIIEAICREFNRVNMEASQTSEYFADFKLPSSRIINTIGTSFENATEIINSLVSEGYIKTVKVLADQSGWKLSVTPPKMIELFNQAVEGKKLTTDQQRLKKRLDNVVSTSLNLDSKQVAYGKLQKDFDEGKWLRLCCPACGDFIQEIREFEELRTLDCKEIECRRRGHKLRFKLDGNKIEFQSIDVEITPLLRDKNS